MKLWKLGPRDADDVQIAIVVQIEDPGSQMALLPGIDDVLHEVALTIIHPDGDIFVPTQVLTGNQIEIVLGV